ncbi:glycogen debranching protein GlgX [Roseicitreum antarcticum]|uniref:Glycogen operon protein n=1 Tax=Roseicitreum antarcticum TaxID=564137 RepID=A0A1H2XP76_9RHOB|nr:glycogen debranching protein GlgX [Roseicitreum antarcticum]SDW94448.1 glycogen operon protein [Roseicitreum antarcticum]
MSHSYTVSRGRHNRIGATFDGDGVNFAVFSEHATAVELCLFSPDGTRELARLKLPERTGFVWHGRVPGLVPGQLYGYRAHGPYAPEEGHRFNPHKLLLDPYAKRITGHPRWSDALFGYNTGAKTLDLTYSNRDSARFMPKCVVEDPSFNWGNDSPPAKSASDSVIYEAHVKGFTAQRDIPHAGKFLGLASDAAIDHLVKLGITAIELLPVQAFLNDRFLVEKKLTNYWGYQTLSFFAPEPRYLTAGRLNEFQHTVARLHAAGIEVILDVVYNHTCEGSELGPTLSFRGLDNKSYYRLSPDNPRYCINDTGCGNTINIDHPMVLRMVMDSLRYWVEVMHVDGFRFDLAATLAREAAGFQPNAAFFAAIRQDPVLSRVKLIAEPWDIGPDGYQLGAFPHPFMEWNDKFRDGVRRFWRRDPAPAPELAARLTGSAQQFDHNGRGATASINFVTAHDGFNLHDLVSYAQKHNEANGEDGRDGHSANFSDNMGVEGETDDPDIRAARSQRKRNLLATLMLSQGTPMLLAGDEVGHSQRGNNNAYCQDNAITWIDWDSADADLMAFTARLIAFRKAHQILRQKLFLHSRERPTDGKADLMWWHPAGRTMTPADWEDPALSFACVELRKASSTPVYADTEYAVFLAFNAGDAFELTLPPAPEGQRWSRHINTAAALAPPEELCTTAMHVAAQSVSALVLERVDTAMAGAAA